MGEERHTNRAEERQPCCLVKDARPAALPRGLPVPVVCSHPDMQCHPPASTRLAPWCGAAVSFLSKTCPRRGRDPPPDTYLPYTPSGQRWDWRRVPDATSLY